MLQLPPGLPDFLISRPIKKLYKPAIWNAIQTTEPGIYARTNQYELFYLIDQVSNNKRAERKYTFEFVKVDKEFKFFKYESTAFVRFIDPPLDSMTWYFPPGNYAEKKVGDHLHLHKFTNTWYSLTLKNCEEPVLYNYKGLDEIYRVTWLRAFHYPVVFRFQKQGFNFLLTTKVLLERNDEYPDELETNTTTSVSFFKWYKFKSKLAEADFWKLDFKDADAEPMDGSRWIVEGVNEGKYHMIERWFPEPELRKACLYLLSISNLKISKRNIY